jgi:hypothetical protein
MFPWGWRVFRRQHGHRVLRRIGASAKHGVDEERRFSNTERHAKWLEVDIPKRTNPKSQRGRLLHGQTVPWSPLQARRNRDLSARTKVLRRIVRPQRARQTQIARTIRRSTRPASRRPWVCRKRVFACTLAFERVDLSRPGEPESITQRERCHGRSHIRERKSLCRKVCPA